jgi:WD40 repeat protein
MRNVSVNSVMFSNNSHYVAAGSSDSLIKIWDMKNHKHVYLTLDSHNGAVTSLGWIKFSGF